MAEPMTYDEYKVTLRGLEPRLYRYANLLVSEGVALQSGQELVIQAPVEAAAFARLAARAGYDAGAKHVTVIWLDDELSRLDYDRVATDLFEHVPAWKREQMNGLAADGAAFLLLDGTDPDALTGADPKKIQIARRARNTQCDVWRHGMDFGENAWSIGGVPTAKWARKVFPGLRTFDAIIRLWETILDCSRVSRDPVSDWETHVAMLAKNQRRLNDWHFDRLHYTSSNGTDLTIGLPARHLWGSGSMTTTAGVRFAPNIPSEEVYTTPDRKRAEGIVYSALPLSHGGAMIRDFWLVFENGEVTDFDAAEGADVLESIVETDDGARRLGEVALISKNTPIRQSGLIFYNTLYDENASCHLALGMGFPDCYEGGDEMSEAELEVAGVNRSATHVDFMIGAEDLNITGVTPDGEEIEVFTSGQWAWE